jgi:cation:H+ antiporter
MVAIPVIIDTVMFLVGVAILVYSVEELIENITKAALLTGVSAFLFAVFFAGMDFENWAFGVAAVVSGLSGVAIGSAFGSALFLVGVSVALAGVLVPFEPAVPSDYLLLLIVSPLIALPLLLDGRLSRADGVLLLVVFAAFLGYLYWHESHGRETFRDEETEEAREALEDDGRSQGITSPSWCCSRSGWSSGPNWLLPVRAGFSPPLASAGRCSG